MGSSEDERPGKEQKKERKRKKKGGGDEKKKTADDSDDQSSESQQRAKRYRAEQHKKAEWKEELDSYTQSKAIVEQVTSRMCGQYGKTDTGRGAGLGQLTDRDLEKRLKLADSKDSALMSEAEVMAALKAGTLKGRRDSWADKK